MKRKSKVTTKNRASMMLMFFAALIQVWFAALRPLLNPGLTAEQLFWDNALPLAVTIALVVLANMLARSAQDEARAEVQRIGSAGFDS